MALINYPRKRRVSAAAAAGVAAAAALAVGFSQASPPGPATATPIKHLVVIFQENVSFDHYFGTYPNAANTAGEPPFTAAREHAGGQRPATRDAC